MVKMKGFIRVTGHTTNSTRYLNPLHIVSVYRNGNYTEIELANNKPLFVVESVDEIALRLDQMAEL